MAGSFNHVIALEDNQQLTLRKNLYDSVDNMGDALETIEEMFNMILKLSGGDVQKIKEAQDAYYVENYKNFQPKSLNVWLNDLHYEL